MTNTHRLLLTAVLGILPLTGMAAQPGSPFGWPYGHVLEQPVGPMADRSRDERAKFRARGQELSPQEEEAMLRELRQQWREVPPEARQQQRYELMERLRDRQRGRQEQEEGYGQGYESRNWERPDSGSRQWEQPATGGSRRGRR